MPSTKLLTYLDALIDALRDNVPKAIAGDDVKAVHDARVATRRMKAAIDLLDPVFDRRQVKPFGRTLRKLRRKLGPLRDLDVMGEHLRELKQNADAERTAAIEWLESRFAESRGKLLGDPKSDRRRNKVLTKLGAWWGVREQIDEAEAAIDHMLCDSLSNQFTDFSRASEVLANGKSESGVRIDPHEVRIAGKSLRYTLEMAAEQGHAPAKHITKIFKKMQDELGLWHDFVVLTERMISVSGDDQLAHHDSPTQRAILALAQQTLRRAEKHLERFASLWKEHGLELAAAIDAVCAMPHTVPSVPISPASISLAPASVEASVTGSRTDPDPTDSGHIEAPAAPSPDAPEAA